MRDKTILLIDDDPMILEAARRLLEREGLTVEAYGQAFNATNFAARTRPDLVLMDVNMPFLSGDNLAGLFAQHPLLSKVPVVLFSSNHESELRRMANEIGAAGYIPKSELAGSFVHSVRRFLLKTRHSSAPPP